MFSSLHLNFAECCCHEVNKGQPSGMVRFPQWYVIGLPTKYLPIARELP